MQQCLDKSVFVYLNLVNDNILGTTNDASDRLAITVYSY